MDDFDPKDVPLWFKIGFLVVFGGFLIEMLIIAPYVVWAAFIIYGYLWWRAGDEDS